MKYFIFALIAALLFGIAPIFSKIGLQGVNPGIALTIRSFIITVVMLGWLLFSGGTPLLADVKGTGWLFIALDGICAALLGQLFYYYALKAGEASIVVPVVAAFPLFTLLVASFFLGEKITPLRVGGLLLVVLGVVMIRL